jgi:transcriptional regulator with XRE-family HTH domain
MINTTFLLSAIKSKHCTPSDYRVAKMLGLSTTTVSGYRCKGEMPSDITLSKISELLKVPPHILYAAIQHERARDPSAKRVWAETYRLIGGDELEKRLTKECFTDMEEKAGA